jgi:predicted metal-dependent phosphoesterase TrpH
MANPHESLQGTDRVDLHLHTLASDGFWTPDTLTTYLAEHGFARLSAITTRRNRSSRRSTLAAKEE